MKILASLLIYLLIFPLIILSIPIVSTLLLTSWTGRTTIFGNEKWGRANNHPVHPTTGYWQEFAWLVWRNPVNNLMAITLAVKQKPYILVGDSGIGEKYRGGFYRIYMGKFWEYYWIKPYGKRCIRARIGWKINGKSLNERCEFVFTITPWKEYLGA